MSKSRMVICVALLTLTAKPGLGQNASDPFAEIGAMESETTVDLVTPEPPQLPARFLPHETNDLTAAFEPADKLDTPAELETALAVMRSHFAPFLENHAPNQRPTRRVQQLREFDWRTATPADWKNFESALAGSGEWEAVTIPHYGEPLGKTNTFYRRTFITEPWAENEAVFIRFRGVDYKAHVFINGACVGSHVGFFAPFEFDITPFVSPGTNTLFVRVENDYPTLGNMNHPKYPDLIGGKIYAATGPGYDDPVAGWHHCPPGMGIYQPVSIEIRPRVHVHDIFVRPLPEENAAEMKIEVWSSDIFRHDIEIQYGMYGLNFETVALAPRIIESPDAVGAGVNFYRVRIPRPEFRRWDLDTPWLYDLQVTVSCPEINTTDNAHQHFGMRSFRFDESGNPKGRFVLNGQEIRLRGANTMGSEQQCVMRDDVDQLRDDLLLAKATHMNFLRFTQRPV